MTDVVKFVRQLAHDLRNHLNAAELQSAYIAEIAEGPELKEEIKRLRATVSEVAENLQSLTWTLSQPRLTEMPYAAADFMGDLRQRLTADHADDCTKVEWDVQVEDSFLQIDPQALLPALTELFENAFRHDRGEGAISVEARIEGDRFVFTMREPKAKFEGSTDNWAREPLRSVGRGHYGLGLHRSMAVIEAHRGKLDARYDSAASSLVTRVLLPLHDPAK